MQPQFNRIHSWHLYKATAWLEKYLKKKKSFAGFPDQILSVRYKEDVLSVNIHDLKPIVGLKVGVAHSTKADAAKDEENPRGLNRIIPRDHPSLQTRNRTWFRLNFTLM